MLKNFFEWRKAKNVDSIFDELKDKVNEISSLQQYFPHGWHGIDKEGRPIWIERGGMFDGDGIMKLYDGKGVEFMERYTILMSESRMKL